MATREREMIVTIDEDEDEFWTIADNTHHYYLPGNGVGDLVKIRDAINDALDAGGFDASPLGERE